MSNYDWPQLQALWKFAGGNASREDVMAAISLAESSGEAEVVSPAGAIGLWQVMPFWAPHFGWPVSYLYQPYYNARAAVGISGGGYHLGAWDTCYNPPSAAANRLDLSWPETGSPAWDELRSHGAGTTGGGGGGGSTGPSGADAVLMRQFAWANHLAEYAVVNNTNWVSWNRTLRPPSRRPVTL